MDQIRCIKTYENKEDIMKRFWIMVIVLTVAMLAKGDTGAIENYFNNVKIGDPVEYRNLRIFPVIATSALSHKDYATMDEAMDRGWLKIRESGSGNVNTVEVRNDGKEMVFILTGEMVTGAKQDRMVEKDVLLPSHSGWIKVAVYCVEHGRWSGPTPEFKSSRLVAPNVVRERAKNTESQSEVWAGVAESQSKLNIGSATGNVKDNYEDKHVQKEIADYEQNFDKIPGLSRSTIGVVVTTGSRIICFDMFANNDLLKKFWRKLIKSYAMDALSGEKSDLDRYDINDFLETIAKAKYVSSDTPGLGDLYSIESNIGKGSALVYGDAVVHMDFFPRADIIRHHDSDLKLDFRREQRRKD